MYELDGCHGWHAACHTECRECDKSNIALFDHNWAAQQLFVICELVLEKEQVAKILSTRICRTSS